METVNCILCRTEDPRPIKKDFVGLVYVGVDGKIEEILADGIFDIWHCDVCDTRFVTPYQEADYGKIYNQTETYTGLLEFAEKIKDDPDPFWTLIGRGQQYYAVFDFVKNKNGLRILDTGCGYGYMVHALTQLGHSVAGIEVVESVVNKAKKLYGDMFYLTQIENVYLKDKPDLVIALEVMEHLSDPLKFTQLLQNIVKDGGNIIITTPDRVYIENRTSSAGESMLKMGWAGEMPPVHLAMYSKKSMEYLAKKLNMKVEFTNFPGGHAQTIGAIFTK